MAKGTLKRFKKIIFNKKISAKDIVTTIKKDVTIETIDKDLSELARLKIYNNFIFGRALPKSYSDLGKSSTLYFIDSFEKQVNWLTMAIINFNEEINKFLIYREEFERFLLNGDYESCKTSINRINTEICYSIWSIEKLLLVSEYQDGLEKNKEELTKIVSNNNNQYVTILSEFLSRRCEKNMSVAKYEDTLEKFLENSIPDDSRVREYFHFKLNYFNYGEFRNLSEIMHLESQLSIIDRYLSFINIVQTVVINGDNEQKEFVSKNLLKLIKKIDDPILHRLVTYFDPSHLPEKIEQINHNFLEIIDNYTIGNYEKSYQLSKFHKGKLANDFDMLELLIKSMLYTNKTPECKKDNKSILEEVMVHMYNIYNKNKNTTNSLKALIKINNTLGEMIWNKRLFLYIKYSNNSANENYIEKLMDLNSNFITPRFARVFTKSSDSTTYLNSMNNYFILSPSIYFFRSFFGDERSKANIKDTVPLIREKNYLAKKFINNNQLTSAINIYEQIISEMLAVKTEGYHYEEIIYNLFNCYLNSLEITKALNLAIGNYLFNPNYILRLDLKKLYKLLEENKQETDINNTSTTLPILYYLLFSTQDTKGLRKIYTGYANFLRGWKIKRPTELKSYEQNLDKKELVFFLKNICIPIVMDSSYVFTSQDEIENERILICEWLIEIDNGNSSVYVKEISDITKNLLVRKRIQEVEESKIYVDTTGIINSVDQNFKESFNRYKQFEKFSKKEIYRMLDVIIKRKKAEMDQNLNNIIIFDEEFSKQLLTRDYQFIAYKEMFIEMLDKFISSNEYGLDCYLSTRIRHGTILSHLRSIFTTEKLISEKDNITNSYINNNYWLNKINKQYEEELSKILNSFSKRIDKLINTVPLYWIQIKTETKNPDGLFDYIFDDNQIYRSFSKNKSINDYRELMNEIIKELWERTEHNLSVVKHKISIELQELLLKEIGNFEIQLKDFYSGLKQDEGIIDLLRSITRCRTTVQVELNNICKWFNLPEDKTLLDFKIDELINTCLEYSKKLYPHFQLNPSVHITTNKIFNGSKFPYFVDVMLILIDNITTYYINNKEVFQDVEIIIDCNKTLNIRVENSISTDETEQRKLDEKIKKIYENLNENIISDNISREGGSGFYKIFKIIRYDLQSNGKIDFFIEDNKFIVTINLSTERVLVDEYTYN